MRKSIIPGAAIVASLAFAGIAHADTNVQSLTGDWSTSNSTVAKTADGVHFGTYVDGGLDRWQPELQGCQRHQAG